MKMHWAVRTLLVVGGGAARGGAARVVLRAIQGAISYMASLVRGRCGARSNFIVRVLR